MDNNQTHKPLSMLIEETKHSLLYICNKSNLHPSILELIVKDIYNDVVQVKNILEKKEKEIFDNHELELKQNIDESSYKDKLKEQTDEQKSVD